MANLIKERIEIKKSEIRKLQGYPKRLIEMLFHLLDKMIKVIGSSESENDIRYIWSGTQAEYDALATKRDDTLYFID